MVLIISPFTRQSRKSFDLQQKILIVFLVIVLLLVATACTTSSSAAAGCEQRQLFASTGIDSCRSFSDCQSCTSSQYSCCMQYNSYSALGFSFACNCIANLLFGFVSHIMIYTAWCSQQFKCVPSQIAQQYCAVDRDLRPMWLGTANTHAQYQWSFPLHCDTGRPIASIPQQCSRLNMTVLMDNYGSVSMIQALMRPNVLQPHFGSSLNDTEGILPVLNYSTVIPGVFFDVESLNPQRHHTPRFYSYRRHVLQNIWPGTFPTFDVYDYNDRSVSIQDRGTISIMDVRVVADPGSYKMGYVLATRLNDSSVDCSWQLSNRNMFHVGQMYYVYIDAGFILQFPLFIAGLVLIAIPIIFCQSKFEDGPRGCSDSPPAPAAAAVSDKTGDEQSNSSTATSSSQQSLSEDADADEDDVPLNIRVKNALVRCWEVLKSVFSTADVKLIRSCGNDAFFYIRFNTIILFVLLCITFTSIPALVCNLVARDIPYFKDFAASTIAALSSKSPFFIATLITAILQPLIVAFSRIFLIRLSTQVAVDSKRELADTLHTVIVSRIPKTVTSKDKILQHFRKIYGDDKVADAQLQLNLHDFYKLKKRRDRTAERLQIARAHPRRRITPNWLKPWKRINAADHYEQLLAMYEEELQACVERTNETREGTGLCFVTFTCAALTARVIENFKSSSWRNTLGHTEYSDELDTNSWHVKRAQPAVDIAWQNLGYSRKSRILRSILANGLYILVLLFINVVTIAASMFWVIRELVRQNINSALMNSVVRWIDGLFPSSLCSKGNDCAPYTLFGILWIDPLAIANGLFNQLPVVTAIVTLLMPPLLAFVRSFEKHKSLAKNRQRFMYNNMFYLFFNTVILPQLPFYVAYLVLVELYADSAWRNLVYFYNVSGISLTRFIIAFVLIGKALELIFMFISLMVQLTRNGSMRRPAFNYETNYSYTLLVVLLVLFTPTVPIIAPFAFLYVLVSATVDKLLIMWLYKRSRDSNGTLPKLASSILHRYSYLYPIIVLLTCTSQLWWYMLVFVPVAYVSLGVSSAVIKVFELRRKAHPTAVSSEGTINEVQGKNVLVRPVAFGLVLVKNFTDELNVLVDDHVALASKGKRRLLRHLRGESNLHLLHRKDNDELDLEGKPQSSSIVTEEQIRTKEETLENALKISERYHSQTQKAFDQYKQ